MEYKIRILVADDHAIVREGLRALISGKPDMELVGEAADGEEAVLKAGLAKPDVILMDLVMPRKNGLEAIKEIKRAQPNARILVLTSFAEEEQIVTAVKSGALGYLLKDSSPHELIEAIRCVYRGDASLHPEVARKLVLGLGKTPKPEPEVSALTERELQVLQWMARGFSNPAIAAEMHIGEGTVRYHVSNVLSKLGFENRTQAVLYAVREGLVELRE